MRRYFKIALLALLAIVLLVVSLANRQMVTLQALPPDLAGFLGAQFGVELPLFAVVLIGVAVGVLIGFIWEWLREHRYRAEAARAKRELARRGGSLEPARKTPDEELAALLEDTPPGTSKRGGR